MTPQEKAKVLMMKFDRSQINILCDEIMNSVAFYNHKTKREFESYKGYPDNCFLTYWQEVKTENNK